MDIHLPVICPSLIAAPLYFHWVWALVPARLPIANHSRSSPINQRTSSAFIGIRREY